MALKSSYTNHLIESGTDEAGRGCIAGPVVAAAVILPKNFSHPLLNDSKKMSKKNRLILKEIIEKEAISFGVSFVDHHKIDEINILNASFLAMNQAIEKLRPMPELILVDGNRFKTMSKIPYECIIKGDGKYSSIAAASILAKTYRDAYMKKIADEFPEYEWKKNKGYPTPKHKSIVLEKGRTTYHRKTFQLKPIQLKLDL